jgi:hypothetical protein
VASNFPPDDWVFIEGDEGLGVWNTDASREETLVLTGEYTLKFNNSGHQTVMGSTIFPVIPGQLYRMDAAVRASSVAAGRELFVGAAFYEVDATTVESFGTVIEGVLASADTWHHLAAYMMPGADARWGQKYVAKLPASGGAVNTFNAYFDRILINPCAMWFKATHSSTQTIAADSTARLVEFNTDTNTDPAGVWNTTSDTFTAPRPGIWEFTASMYCTTTITDGKYLLGIFKHNGTVVAEADFWSPGGAAPVVQCTSGPLVMAAGDTVLFYLESNNTGNLSISNDSSYTWIKGVEVAV